MFCFSFKVVAATVGGPWKIGRINNKNMQNNCRKTFFLSSWLIKFSTIIIQQLQHIQVKNVDLKLNFQALSSLPVQQFQNEYSVQQQYEHTMADRALKCLSPFQITYLCQSGFSTFKGAQNKTQSKWTTMCVWHLQTLSPSPPLLTHTKLQRFHFFSSALIVISYNIFGKCFFY